MAPSQQLRERDLREARELIGQCRELGFDPGLWRLHLMGGFRRLVGASVSTGMELVVAEQETLRVIGAVSCGWACDEFHKRWSQFVRHADPLMDVVLEHVFREHQRQPGLLTRTREQILDTRTWRRSIHYNEYRKTSELDSCIYSWCPVATNGAPERADLIAIHRAPNDKPFGERERRLVGEVHRQVGELIGKHLASPYEPSVAQLPLRQRQTLQCLLEGLSEKEAAARFDLSPRTLHRYVAALYRHFGVHSRGELLARWIRYGPPIVLPGGLAPRLQQVLQLLLEGASETAIADRLALSVHTVHQYVKALLNRFEASSRAELMAQWIGVRVDWDSSGVPLATPATPSDNHGAGSAEDDDPSR